MLGVSASNRADDGEMIASTPRWNVYRQFSTCESGSLIYLLKTGRRVINDQIEVFRERVAKYCMSLYTYEVYT